MQAKGRWHILANAHPVISVKVFQRLILRGIWEKRGEIEYFSLVRSLLLVSTLDLRLILGGVGKAKGQISPGLKSPIDFLTSHRCTKYYIFLLHANNQ